MLNYIIIVTDSEIEFQLIYFSLSVNRMSFYIV